MQSLYARPVLQDRHGVAALEYAVLAALIASMLAIGTAAFQPAMTAAFGGMAAAQGQGTGQGPGMTASSREPH